jgi:transcription-repair coupling factor (superfamily II helicase)
MIDRFGPLPTEVQHLLKIVFIKALCRKANVEKLDAGPKGVVVQFRNKEFPEPGRAGRPHFQAGQHGQDPARPERGVHPRPADG